MRLLSSDLAAPKGWLDGPWLSGIPISLGYATAALDEPHEHATLTEIFLVGRGTATANVDGSSIDLTCGDVLVVEPGEARAILRASDDLQMFVIHVAGDDGEQGNDKTIVERSRLGLPNRPQPSPG
jgi:mannose-6-phosphate isomerase-like protein (cupin superfamily)